METLTKTISSFNSINLSEMKNVQLMNRMDTKFVFTFKKLNRLLERISKHYFVLEIDGSRLHDYKSLYFDTNDRKFYIDHHNQRVNRNKVRFREYVGSGLIFLEIKSKNNKGKTIKKRMKVQNIVRELDDQHKAYIKEVLGKSLKLSSKHWINFSRITCVHKILKERLTIDINLNFSDQEKKKDFNHIIIAEVKQERISRSSDFIRIAKEMNILPTRLSKYCISTTQLCPEMKRNRFKKKLLFIEKLKRNN